MNTTELTRPRRALSARDSGPRADRSARPAASELPTIGEILEQIIPLIGVIAVVAPPVVFLAGPWLLLGLMLSGPFALVVTLFVLAMALVALAASIVAILAAPYLLVRYVREHRARHAVTTEPTAPVVSLESPRVVA